MNPRDFPEELNQTFRHVSLSSSLFPANVLSATSVSTTISAHPASSCSISTACLSGSNTQASFTCTSRSWSAQAGTKANASFVAVASSLPWQTQCIQQPVPTQELETFLSVQDVANDEPPEISTLAVAHATPHDQTTEMIRQRLWCVSESEKQRRYETAQPAWKSELQRQQQAAASSRPPVSTLPGAAPLETLQRKQNPLSQLSMARILWIRMLPALRVRTGPSGWTTRRTTSTPELALSSMSIAAQNVEVARFLGELASQHLASFCCVQKAIARLSEQPSRLCSCRRVRRRNEEECYM